MFRGGYFQARKRTLALQSRDKLLPEELSPFCIDALETRKRSSSRWPINNEAYKQTVGRNSKKWEAVPIRKCLAQRL